MDCSGDGEPTPGGRPVASGGLPVAVVTGGSRRPRHSFVVVGRWWRCWSTAPLQEPCSVMVSLASAAALLSAAVTRPLPRPMQKAFRKIPSYHIQRFVLLFPYSACIPVYLF